MLDIFTNSKDSSSLNKDRIRLWNIRRHIVIILFTASLYQLFTGDLKDFFVMSCITMIAYFVVKKEVEKIISIIKGNNIVSCTVKNHTQISEYVFLRTYKVNYSVERKDTGQILKFTLFNRDCTSFHTSENYKLPKVGDDLDVYISNSDNSVAYPVMNQIFEVKNYEAVL